MDNSVLSVDVLAGLAGTLLSLAFNYIPGLREKYAVLDEVKKSWIMALSLLVGVGLIIGASCLNLWVLTPLHQNGHPRRVQTVLLRSGDQPVDLQTLA